jgi:Flp pilus assembly protein TadG
MKRPVRHTASTRRGCRLTCAWRVVKWYARLRDNDSGNSLVEFAFSLSVLLTTIFGILYCSLALYAHHFVANAAREATRYAMVRGSSWNGTSCATTSAVDCTANATNVQNFVDAIAPAGIAAGNLSVATSWPGTSPTGAECDTYNMSTGSLTTGTNNPYCSVKVTVSYKFSFLIPLLPVNAVTLSSTSVSAISE